MKYALGNMLNGAGGLNQDGLSLDLQFAADKTLTARKGPAPVFTRASTATFIGSNGLIQSAAINAARFDHDPVTLASRGLLIEESRTNIPARSEELSVSPWSYNNVTISTNTDVAPDGLTTADKIVENTATSQHSASTLATGLTTGQQYTFSIFLKASGRNFAFVGDFAGVGSEFNLSTGSIVAGGSGSPQIQSMGNGWYRCSVTGNQLAAVAAPTVRIRQTSGVNSYTGDGTSGVLAWGAQFELGSFATSYIPTTTASVVRSADVCSITGANFTSFYNQSEGTLFAGSIKSSLNANSFICHASDGSFDNGVDLRYNNSTTAASVMNVANSNQIAGFSFAVIAGSFIKQSLGYKLNDCAYSVNNASPLVDSIALVPSTTQLSIGNAFGGGFFLNGTISSLRYYRKRLSNTKIQALTA